MTEKEIKVEIEIIQTPSITNKKKNATSYRKEIDECLLILKEQFPTTFFDAGKQKPLKIGIHREIFQLLQNKQIEIKESVIFKSIRWYVSSISYLRACKEGVLRIDLHGEPTDTVTALHTENALKKLKIIDLNRKKLKPPAKETTLPALKPQESLLIPEKKEPLPSLTNKPSEKKTQSNQSNFKATLADKWPSRS